MYMCLCWAVLVYQLADKDGPYVDDGCAEVS